MSEQDRDTGDSRDERSEEGSILDDGGVDTDERAGRSQGIDTEAEPDEDTKQEMEEERERRLDPENRPDGAEIDNTQRTFDTERGMFTDSEDYDESDDPEYASMEEEAADSGSRPEDDSSEDDSEDGSDDADDDAEKDEEGEG